MIRINIGNTIFEGQNNAYLLDAGDDQWVLVDTAIALEEPRAEFIDALAEHEVEMADIDDVVLTHYHEDHSGLAGEIQAAGGATVWAHTADAPMVARDPGAIERVAALEERRFNEWNVPASSQAEFDSAMRSFEESEVAMLPTVEPFTSSDVLKLGSVTLRALHLPGHTAGQCGFVMADDDRTELLAGDALLPHYTPNVGGADLRVDKPLEKYLKTLATIARREFDRAWSGHRDPIDDPAARARELIAHHYERSERVLDILDIHGPTDVWTVSAHLFGSLEEVHILHGPGEAFAHLDHLHRAGIVDRTPDGYDYDGTDVDLVPFYPMPP